MLFVETRWNDLPIRIIYKSNRVWQQDADSSPVISLNTGNFCAEIERGVAFREAVMTAISTPVTWDLSQLSDYVLCIRSQWEPASATAFADRVRQPLLDHLLDCYDDRIDADGIADWAIEHTLRRTATAHYEGPPVKNVRNLLFLIADQRAYSESVALNSEHLDLDELKALVPEVAAEPDVSFQLQHMNGEDCVRVHTIGGVFFPQASPLP